MITLKNAAAVGVLLLSGAVAVSMGEPPSVSVPLRHVFRDEVLELHEPHYALADGTEIQITRLEYLISNVRVQRAGGEMVTFPGQYFHIDAKDPCNITLSGLAPLDKVSTISFTIGLDAKTNHADPNQWPAGHALSPLDNNLLWDWQGGYVFLAIEGRVHPSDPKRPAFLYHIGNDGNRIDVTCSLAHAIAAEDLQIDFDVDRLWDGDLHVSLTQDSNFTHSRAGDELAQKLVKNAKSAFKAGEKK
ncbi:hypothetical protein IT570_00805 [Candidatus Sumerlaeota bacterium]|nr:hypothetical protein [Candidatus Sumerlaeota bacterium]